jgi:osmotically-inducible protein OsmY
MTTGMSDNDIRLRINRSVAEDPILDSATSDVTISVDDGEVVLTGSVDSAQVRDNLGSRAASVVGAEHVRNDLGIR